MCRRYRGHKWPQFRTPRHKNAVTVCGAVEEKSRVNMYHIPKRNIIRGGCKYDAASLKTSGVGNEDIQAETRMPEDFIGAVRRNTNSGH